MTKPLFKHLTFCSHWNFKLLKTHKEFSFADSSLFTIKELILIACGVQVEKFSA